MLQDGYEMDEVWTQENASFSSVGLHCREQVHVDSEEEQISVRTNAAGVRVFSV